MSPSLKTFETYHTPIVLERGKGVYLWDIDGKAYVDMLGQNLCVSIGYNHPTITRAARKQLSKLAHCTTVYYNETSANLAQSIVGRMPKHPSGEEWTVHFVNSGSEAVDLAVQMARIYTGHHEMYALHKGYHGLQGCAAGLTAIGKSSQKAYASTYVGIKHVPANHLAVLEHDLTFSTCGKVAGIIMEPLQGYGGIHPLHHGYMQNAFELIQQHGGVTIADEVQTGYGRLGKSFWGFQMENNDVIPDMITIAKGMGNGVGILGAVVCRRSIAEAFSEKMFFNTYGANPYACAVGKAVLDVMSEEGIMNNCYKQGLYLKEKAQTLCIKYPDTYREIRGDGLFLGLEIAGNTDEIRQKRTIEVHEKVKRSGVLIGRGSAEGNVFRLQPPMSIQKDDLDVVLNALENVARI